MLKIMKEIDLNMNVLKYVLYIYDWFSLDLLFDRIENKLVDNKGILLL